MDNLIYGLLIIAWIAYGIYSAAKKNKAKGEIQRGSSTRNTTSMDTVESLLASLFQGTSTNPLATNNPYSPPNYTEESFEQEQVITYQNEQEISEYEENDFLDVVPESVIESKIDTYSGSDNINQSVIVPEEEFDEIKNSAIDNDKSDLDYTESTIFDLRQGIIAQAILERPFK